MLNAGRIAAAADYASRLLPLAFRTDDEELQQRVVKVAEEVRDASAIVGDFRVAMGFCYANRVYIDQGYWRDIEVGYRILHELEILPGPANDDWAATRTKWPERNR